MELSVVQIKTTKSFFTSCQNVPSVLSGYGMKWVIYHWNVLGDNHLVNGRTAKGMLLSGSGGGGLVVRVLALYYIRGWICWRLYFFVVKCCQKTAKINKKTLEVGPFFIPNCSFVVPLKGFKALNNDHPHLASILQIVVDEG